MHRAQSAILIIDILEEILSHLRCLGGDDREKRSALLSAAQVCTTFREPAIKSLWWALPGIEPALKLLVLFSLLYVEAPQRTPVQYRSRPSYSIINGAEIAPEHWARFLQYTVHTRVIHGGPAIHYTNPAVYVYLSYKNHGLPIFPHLESLAWFSDKPDHLGLRLMASSKLRRLHITIGRSGVAISEAMQPGNPNPPEAPPSASDTLLQTALPRLTGLRELHYRTFSYMAPPREMKTWTSLGQSRELRVLRLDDCCNITDPSYLRGLASLPHLAELQLAVALDRPAPTDIRGFKALQKLCLSVVGMIDPGPCLLSSFASPHLHTLFLLYRRAFPSAVADSLNIAGRQFPHLRSLSVKVHSGVISAPAALPTFSSVFGQIMECLSMERVRIDTHRDLILCEGSDAELEVLAAKWPSLRRLSLLTTFAGPITHRTLCSVERHCPELRTLHLRDLSFCSLTDGDLETTQPGRHPLKTIGICRASYVESPKCSALLLHRLFPRLQMPDRYSLWTCPSCTRCPDHGTCAQAIIEILDSYQSSRSSIGRRNNGSRAIDVAPSAQSLAI
ncbi:hypothetical protein OH77DRAFT_1058588 [Trametes cingulata]|nr:hypothetical protein OH77DRAFT_1058588 [Trametes cingulata]